VSSVIVGARTAEQVEQNVKYDWVLTPSERAEVDAIVAGG
jgi:aryl-alcohol dehydrogenase-like predicted oxidoreductase